MFHHNDFNVYAILCATWYHLYNLKNVKSIHGEVTSNYATGLFLYLLKTSENQRFLMFLGGTERDQLHGMANEYLRTTDYTEWFNQIYQCCRFSVSRECFRSSNEIHYNLLFTCVYLPGNLVQRKSQIHKSCKTVHTDPVVFACLWNLSLRDI